MAYRSARRGRSDARVAEQKTGAAIKTLPTLIARQKKQNSNQRQT